MSILNVNKINPVGGGSTITIAGIASVTSSVTSPSFVGAVTGNVTGNADTASGLSGNPSINTTGIVTATSFVPTVGQLSHRNLVTNGAMNIAQRGTSSTTQGFQTLDRFAVWFSGTDEAPTQEQYVMNSNDTGPWESGFRNAIKVTNGNQTSGAGAGDYVFIRTKIEAQDIANSGWDYLNPNSFITLSFWVKASVAQTYNFRLETSDGTNYNYPFQYTVSSSSAWQKVTHSIPGNANLVFNNDNGNGLELHWQMFRGTDFTDNSVSNDTWAVYASGTRTKDATSTWYTTNDAAFRLTGVQFEVGPVATPFEHRSFGDELRRCQRYYIRLTRGGGNAMHFPGSTKQQQYVSCSRVELPTTMRTAPSVSFTGTRDILNYSNDNSGFSGDIIDTDSFNIRWGSSSGIGDGTGYTAALTGNPNYIECSAEL